jgi:hypothetical protein
MQDGPQEPFVEETPGNLDQEPAVDPLPTDPSDSMVDPEAGDADPSEPPAFRDGVQPGNPEASRPDVTSRPRDAVGPGAVLPDTSMSAAPSSMLSTVVLLLLAGALVTTARRGATSR